MKKHNTKTLLANLFALVIVGLVMGCAKDPNDPGTRGTNLPPKEDYFNFKLRGDFSLDVNYNVPGLSAIIEVYDQDPMMEDGITKKEGINPVYVAYTKDGKYQGQMNIPTAVEEAYLYTKSFSAPMCVKLNAATNGFAYDVTNLTGVETRNTTPKFWGATPVGLVDNKGTKLPYEVATTANDGGKRDDNLYSITAWNPSGWECVNQSYYTKPAAIGAADEPVGVVAARLRGFLEAQRTIDGNKSLLRDPKDINLKVPAEGMAVEVTYVGEQASCYNTLGYYYYEDKGQTLTPDEFLKIRKYIIIPNVDANNMTAGETVKLLYFDEAGVQSEKFPANFVIGWFVISNGFGSSHPATGQGGYMNGGVIKSLDAEAYASSSAYSSKRLTCMSDDKGDDRRFVSLYDTKSKLRVIGVEDAVFSTLTPDDYMDVMFIVRTTPDLGGGDLPPIGPVDPTPDPALWTVNGTLAYEDIWPYGGDYDLNDVIIEYHREITFDKDNIVSKIKETFKPVQKKGSAAQDNFFACQYKNMGSATLPAGVINELGTGSIVITEDTKLTDGKEYIIERDMSGLDITQDEAIKDFNPYIITKEYSTENRVEVHLPMFDMTSAADIKLMNTENAYYIAKNKLYPFAIDIPIAGFIPADETKKIDTEGQYPEFAKWAASNGKEAKDWYLHKGAK